MNRLEYPTALVERVTIIPASVDQTRLTDKGLLVVQGLTLGLTKQLIERSKEGPVRKNCVNDAATRFPDVPHTIEWQEKGRLALPLVRYTGKDLTTAELATDPRALAQVDEADLLLQGFGWMGPGRPKVEKGEPEIPGTKTTFAVRIYDGANGQGNATPYVGTILNTHDALYGNDGVWLETWGADNPQALVPYGNNGFEQVAEIPGMRHGEEVPRVYMTLGSLAAA